MRALLPGARINLGDDRRPHLAVEAMLRMSTAARPTPGSQLVAARAPAHRSRLQRATHRPKAAYPLGPLGEPSPLGRAPKRGGGGARSLPSVAHAAAFDAPPRHRRHLSDGLLGLLDVGRRLLTLTLIPTLTPSLPLPLTPTLTLILILTPTLTRWAAVFGCGVKVG